MKRGLTLGLALIASLMLFALSNDLVLPLKHI